MPTEPESRRVARDLHILSGLTRRVLEPGLRLPGGDAASFTQIVVLKWLDSATPRRAQDVARFLSASAPAATQILARLKRKGLVISRRNLADRRAEDLVLTRKALALVKRHEQVNSRRLDLLWAGLPPMKRRSVLQGLEAAIDLLLRKRPVGADICLHCGALESPQCVMKAHGYSCPTEMCGVNGTRKTAQTCHA